ncbi:nef attachable domain protein [Chlamydia psittaci C6/98]|nr:nef attachable domain protein [Chlamydia psittaci C6/98]
MKKETSSVKTGKKLSEKLLCFVIIHLTELQFSPQEAVH